MSHSKTQENIHPVFRVLKVVAGLFLQIAKFYLLAWFIVPKAFLEDSRAPQTLNELEYEAKNNPAFIVVIALFAAISGCACFSITYVIPALIIAKIYGGGA